MARISFYCRHCKKDLELEPRKEFALGSDEFRFVAPCLFCKRKLIRLSNPQKDPFFHLSKRVIMERDKHAKDVVQYGQSGFSMLYQKQWQEFERQREQYEKAQAQKKKERDEYYKKHHYNINDRQLVRKVLEAEDTLTHAQ